MNPQNVGGGAATGYADMHSIIGWQESKTAASLKKKVLNLTHGAWPPKLKSNFSLSLGAQLQRGKKS
ncbi:MAG: hypothetical protein C5B49_10740 [Bdellovibrio sp.]|nr:MAG: hypothetical protein C5B49_10740 [Bdellovibrio sp.]